MRIREEVLSSAGCSFTAEVTADYGDRTYTFTMGCTANSDGHLDFIVNEPESISGIAGNIAHDGGELTFDDTALAFPLLADGEVSPVSAPWLMIMALRGGYMVAAGMDGHRLRLTLRDSYEADALQVDVWLNGDDTPEYAEILWQGRRVLSVEVREFAFV